MSNEAELTSPEADAEESMVAVFSSSNHDAEMEALTIKGILDASGIPALLIGPSVLPNLEFQVQAPAHLAARAQQVIDEARAAGPVAAEEAELASEKQEPPAV